MPGGQWEHGPEAPAGGPFIGARFVPHDLARDRGPARGEPGAATRQCIRARGGKVDVRLAIALAVTRTAVAGGDRHRDAERGRILERGLHRIARRSGPAVLRTAPADRDHGGFARRIVCRLRYGLVEPRSEERRVGKECRSRWAADSSTK